MQRVTMARTHLKDCAPLNTIEDAIKQAEKGAMYRRIVGEGKASDHFLYGSGIDRSVVDEHGNKIIERLRNINL